MKQLFLFFAFLLPFCALGQLVEPFNHLHIAHTYAWQGDTDRFKPEDGFLRLFDADVSRTASVHLYGAVLEENEWSFRIKSGYKTTHYNYMRVYLWCSSPLLAEEHTGYFVELKDKTISLCRALGADRKQVLISKSISNLEAAFDIHFRVLTDHETITLYARSDGKTEWTEIGRSSYEQEHTPGYFILFAQYTKEHAKDKYFGPVQIRSFSFSAAPSPEEEEDTALVLPFLKQEDAFTLLLSFSRPVNPVYASFQLSLLGEPEQIFWSDDEKHIRLVWRTPMVVGESYTLTYQELFDENMKSHNASLPSFVAQFESGNQSIPEPVVPEYKPGDVLINEVMADPKGVAGLPETEYVELHNRTRRDISLAGWVFIYGTKATELEAVLPAGGYAVLFRAGREIIVDQGGVSLPLASFPAALANTGKLLQLKSPDDTVIDEIAYPKAKPGYSWERIDEGWKLSADVRGGTPGSVNSESATGEEEEDDKVIVQPREIVFSELLPEPQTGGSEYIELYNRSSRALPFSGLVIAVRKADGSLATHYPLSSISGTLEVGDYCVLTKSIARVRDFFLVSAPEKLHELKLPVLANTASRLVLFRSSDGEVIDEVHYSEKWHAPSVKDKKGIALERIDPDGDSQDPANWTSASVLAGGGTPGYANSQAVGTGGGTPTGIDEPEYITATGSYEIAYRLDRAGYLCRASVFDASGRKIAEIANNELLGTEGVLSWDGLASGGNKLAPGVYIFYADLYHPEGGRRGYKKVFLVR